MTTTRAGMDDGKIKEARDTVLKLDANVARLDPRQEGFATVSGEVARDLEALATHLRDAALREPVGETNISQLLVKILQDVASLLRAKDAKVDVQLAYQAGRVASNLAVDSDVNRERLATAGYPQACAVLLGLRAPQLTVDMLHPLVVSLLNLIIEKHAAVMSALSGNNTLSTLLELATSLYTPHLWNDDSLPATVAEYLWHIASCTMDDKSPPTYSLNANTIDIIVSQFNNSWPSSASEDIDVEDALTTDLKIISHASSIFDIFGQVSQLDQINDEQLSSIAGFIEMGKLPGWVDTAEWDDTDIEKPFGIAKGNVARTLVSILADRPNIPATILQRLNTWFTMEDRPDLLSVALLIYGNYARDDKRNESLVSGPDSLLPTVLPLLTPTSTVQTQHAVIGLLRNLAIPPRNWKPLGDAGIIPRLLSMKPWQDTRDIVGSIQGGAIAIVKQLVRDSSNAIQFLHLQDGVDALIALIKRTNDPPIALEGTRVWINCMRSLAASSETEGWETLRNPGIIESVVRLLTAGQKYPLLINEAILGMVYLSTFASAYEAVSQRLLASETVQVEGQDTSRRGVDVLADVIAPPLGLSYPVETQANAFTLVKQLRSEEVEGVIRLAVEEAGAEQRAVAVGAEKI